MQNALLPTTYLKFFRLTNPFMRMDRVDISKFKCTDTFVKFDFLYLCYIKIKFKLVLTLIHINF